MRPASSRSNSTRRMVAVEAPESRTRSSIATGVRQMRARPGSNVRFALDSGRGADMLEGPLCAKNGLMQRSKRAGLFDHIIGAGEEPGRHGEAERPGGLEIE